MDSGSLIRRRQEVAGYKVQKTDVFWTGFFEVCRWDFGVICFNVLYSDQNRHVSTRGKFNSTVAIEMKL